MDLNFDPNHPCIFYVLQRSGHLSLWDIRAKRILQWQTRCHLGRTSFLKICSDSLHIATSARSSEIKLWDIRTLSAGNSVNRYIQIYNKHMSEKLALGFDFLQYERFIVTGSDSLNALIYDTLTGEPVQQVALGPGQVNTVCALNSGALSFFVVYMDGKYLGIVDSEGPTISHEFTSTEQIKAMFSKEAWDEVLSRNVDRLLEATRAVQQTVGINYDEMFATVRNSDLPKCKQLVGDLTSQYEANIKASTPRLVQAFQQYFDQHKEPMSLDVGMPEHKTRRQPSLATAVRKERVTMNPVKSYVVS